ncbi:MAG TPA: hypothetical protein VIS72_01715 [Anaerolineales bacterium]
MSIGLEYALLMRADEGFWQGIAGGGEDDEYPLETARLGIARRPVPLTESLPHLGFQPDRDLIEMYLTQDLITLPVE